ncbi:MAG: hypothetical protein RL091_1008 [Verrucomicrobiota bacterium]
MAVPPPNSHGRAATNNMSGETSDILLGALILVVALPALYFVAQLIRKLQEAWSGRVLAPLAPLLGPGARRRDGSLRGNYQGVALRAFHGKEKNDRWDADNSTGFDAFSIEALDLPGQCNWSLRFHVSGLLGQGPKQLVIHTADPGLRERLAQSGVVEAVSRVSAPTEDYLTVAFDARRQVLTYTDDVSPRSVPSADKFRAQLALVVRLVETNALVNRPWHAPSGAGHPERLP